MGGWGQDRWFEVAPAARQTAALRCECIYACMHACDDGWWWWWWLAADEAGRGFVRERGLTGANMRVWKYMCRMGYVVLRIHAVYDM